MFLLRTGPRVVTLHTGDPKGCVGALLRFPDSMLCGFHEGLDRATDESTICLVDAASRGGPPRLNNLYAVVLVNEDIASFLVDLYAGDRIGGGESADHPAVVPTLGPTILLMRYTGSCEAILARLEQRFGGGRGTFDFAVERGGRGDTLLALTESPLNERLTESDLASTVLLIPKSGTRVFETLRREALVYITENLDTHEWYELRVNIFDSSEHYDLHYKRLLTVLSGLEIGMVLGERWTEDNALALMSVIAFQVRLFTLSEPAFVKEILVGLEYDDDGNRLVDMDLYYRNRKVTWAAARSGRPRGGKRSVLEWLTAKSHAREEADVSRPDKVSEGIRCRRQLLEKLPESAREELLILERELETES